MKIVYVLETWGSGGTEVYVEGLVKYLSAFGYAVHLVCLQEGGEEDDPFLRDVPHSACSLPRLASLLRKERPDICHLHVYTSFLAASVLVRVGGYARCVATLHMPLSAWAWRYRQSWRLAVRLCDSVVGVSSQVLSELDCPSLYPTPVPGAIDATFRSRRVPSYDSMTICGVGRLSREKDWPTLLMALSRVKRKSKSQCVLEHYGDGPLLCELRHMARGLGVEAVWHGRVTQEELAQELSRANLFVLPSRFEGLGLAAVEAMAMGVPTITADFPASKDFIVPGVTGHTFPIGDDQSLAELIIWHMEHRELSEEIGGRGREFVRERFSPDNTYGRYLEIYRRLAGEGG